MKSELVVSKNEELFRFASITFSIVGTGLLPCHSQLKA